MNHVSSPPNAPRLTIVNHCRVAALSPSTRRLADATVRLLVLVRKSDDVTRKYVHRARARVFTRMPLRSRSRSSTFALDSACAVCASHTREKKKKTGRERQSKGGGRDDSGRFEWTIRAGARRRVAFGSVRATARADVGVDVDVGTTRTTRTTRTIEDRDARGGTAFSPRMVGRSFIRLARARNEKRIEANARRWLDDSNARRRRSIVAVAWRWKRLVISSAVARVIRTSSPTRLETSRRSPTNVPWGTLHVTRVITRGCLRTGTFASHNS